MSSLSTEQLETIFSIVEYLNSLKAEKTTDLIDSLAFQIQEAFSISTTPETFKTLSYSPVGLQEIFNAGVKSLNLKHYDDALIDAQQNPKFEAFVAAVTKKGYFDGTEEGSLEYYQRYSKLIYRFKDKATASTSTAATVPTVSNHEIANKEDLERQAEELKSQGNAAINAKNYLEAAVLYSKALKLSSDGPNSHVYYSNRAAAYCHLNKYQEAVNDCKSSLQLVPDYVKAYSRLGLSYFFLEQYEDAVEAYRKAVELEPDNKASADSLRQAQNKLNKVQQRNQNSAVDAASPLGGKLPDLSSMMGNPMMKQALDKMGGSAGNYLIHIIFNINSSN